MILKVTADCLIIITIKIVLDNQFGFINNHHIEDCIVTTFECVNLLNRKGFGGNLALKDDIQKAFDSFGGSFCSS